METDTEKESVATPTPTTTNDQIMETQDSENARNDEVPSTTSSAAGAAEDSNKTTKESRLFSDEMKFMKDFDPNQRLIQKKMKKFTESGVIVDKCDCLIPSCLGCHFYPCDTCGSHRCGHQCREGRRWEYEELEIQGGPKIQKRIGVVNN